MPKIPTKKPNSGVLFKNRKKEPENPDHEHWSDYEGDANIDGVEYWLAGWINTTKNGDKYLGLRFKQKTLA